LLTFIFIYSSSISALEPPTKQQLARYKQDGILKEKIKAAKKLGNHKISPLLYNSSLKYLSKSGVKIPQNAFQGPNINPRHTSMPSEGDIKIFTLLLAFSDAPAPEHQSAEVITNHIFGEGVANRYPNESLTNYYKRSSYDQLNISGDVFEWYTTPYPRADVVSERDVIKEALMYHEQQGVDFSQYDNDGDGVIDYFAVVWTGEIGEWASQWWGHYTSMSDPDFKLSNKSFSSYSWQWLSYDNAEADFSPTVLIHETGHALGLPDYYDYDGSVGAPVEIPVHEMMKNNAGDHNAFSKFLLGWIEPEIIGSGIKAVDLLPSSNSQDALIIMPELTLEKGLSEYFVVQHRDQLLNDARMDNTGLLIWHVDATPTDWGFVYDNSYSEHSLIKLVSADNEHYYQPGHELTTLTTPSSRGYIDREAAVEIKSIIKNDQTISLTAGIVSVPQISLSGIEHLENLSSQNVITATVTSVDSVAKVLLYANDVLVGEDNEAPYEFNLSSDDLAVGSVKIKAEAYTESAMGIAELSSLKLPNEASLVVVNLSNSNELTETLEIFQKPVIELTGVPIVMPENVPAMFILSSTSTQSSKLTEQQFSRINDYIIAGGHVYYENTAWYWQRNEINEQWSQFGIMATWSWSQTVTNISGAIDSVVSGLSYPTPSGWFLISELSAVEGFTSVKNLWDVDGADFSHAVTNVVGDAKIIATSGRFSWLPPVLRTEVLGRYLDFLGLDSAMKPSLVSIQPMDTNFYGESDVSVNYRLSRIYNDGTSSEVSLSVVSENALPELDYLPFESTQISFLPEELSKIVSLTLKDDSVADGDKELFITITGENVDPEASNSYLFIQDNESRGEIQFSQNSLTVNENAGSFNATITRLNGSDDKIEVNIKTVNGTALAGTDFSAIDIDLTFEAGEIEKVVTIDVIDNSIYATNKNFAIELISEHLMTSYQNLSVTINNDEQPPAPPKEKSSSGGGSFAYFTLFMFLVFCTRVLKVK